jgi:hypothetical protein
MPETGRIHIFYRDQRRGFSEVEPFVYEDGDGVTMQFQIGEIQSETLASDPTYLVLSYTRAMMGFMLFHRS